MKIIGTIRGISIREGKAASGFITPDTAILGHEGDIIGSLAVMYDCTLRKNFDEHKKEQIENYVNKLKNSQMTIDVRLTDGGERKKTLQIQGKNRQVWIITQENTRELYDVDGIRIKEISVHDLIKIFNKRLYSDAFEEDELSAHLAVIDKI